MGWQNGVGSLGEPAGLGGPTQSTIVEYALDGTAVNSWSLTGKADGIGSDPANGRLIVTVNEDGNSSLYTISPGAPAGFQLQRFAYSPDPALPSSSARTGGGGVRTGGGTDAVTVAQGSIYISASNPQVLNATAAFQVTLDASSSIASLAPTFHDDAHATSAITGAPVALALTDPDSNDTVPSTVPGYGGQFLLDGQGDQQLVFAAGLPLSPALTQLPLQTLAGSPAGVDDVRFATSSTLLVADRGANTVYWRQRPVSIRPGVRLAGQRRRRRDRGHDGGRQPQPPQRRAHTVPHRPVQGQGPPLPSPRRLASMPQAAGLLLPGH